MLKFTFTGSSQIALTAGKTYAVEISSTSSTVSFYQRGADSYAGGALYLNRGAFNYPNTRDIAMAIVAVGGGSGPTDTLAPTTPGSLTATAVSSSQINLSWVASSDNVTAYDAAGNTSGQSNAASATTLAGSGGSTLKIMPLGDSITDGYLIPGAYRINLHPLLVSSGVNFDFVGAMQNGPSTLPDRDHEGHSGRRIEQVHALIDQWGYITTFKPNIVLLMLGTNDVIQDYQMNTAPARLMALIDRIHELNPNTMVLVANLPTIGPSYLARLNTFNAAIKPLILAKVQAGEKVRFVEQNTGSLWAETYDGVHPNEAGYVKIANNWHMAIMSYLAE